MKSSRGSLTAVDGNELCQTLPDDLLERIIARVPFPFICKVACLSKSWRARFFPISSQDDAASRCLAASFQKQVGEWSSNWESYGPVIVREEDCMAYNRSSNSWRRIPSPFIVDDNYLSEQRSSSLHIEGALLYHYSHMDGHRLYVANIFTRRRKVLPPCPNTEGRILCVKLVTDASSETYKVFLIRKPRDWSDLYSVEIYDSESASWSCKKLQLRSSPEVTIVSNCVYLNGVLYLLENPSPAVLWAFNVEEATIKVLRLRNPIRDISHSEYLVVCNAELLLIVYRNSHCDVMKVDLGSSKLLLLSQSPVTLDMLCKQERPVSDGPYIFFEPRQGSPRMLAYHVGDDKWSFVPVPTRITATKGFKCITVDGGSKLLVGGRELDVISTPGHTDGHLAFYDSATGTLVVGDHCVGESALNFAEWLTEHCKRAKGGEGPKIYLKREDLNHYGAHKINNSLGQALLAKQLENKTAVYPQFASFVSTLNVGDLPASDLVVLTVEQLQGKPILLK